MKVPLAGPHQDLPAGRQDLPSSSTITPTSEDQAVPIESTAQPPSPPQRVVIRPKAPPPPSNPPFIATLIPYIAVFVVLALVVFFAVRFIGLLRNVPIGEVQLTYWGLWEDEQIMDSVIKDFERQNPRVKISYQKQTIRQYRETLTNRLSQGTGPDIFRFHNTWVPILKAYLAAVPTNIYTNQEFERIFYKVMLSDLKEGRGFVGIPLEVDTLALFVNEDILKAAGVAIPRTWDELRSAARQLTVIDSEKRIQTAGVALGTFDNVDHASDIIALMMLQNGVDLRKIDKSISRDGSNLGEDTLSYYVSFAQGDKRVWDDTLDPSTLAFAKGKVAMYFGYSWRIFEIKSLNSGLNFTVVPVPQLPGSNVTFASYWVEGVSKKSRFQKEAFMFLKYLSEKETMQKLFAEQSKLRLFGEPYARKDLAPLLLDNKYVAVFVKQADNAVSWYAASNTYDDGVNDKIIKYIADAIRATSSRQLSPKTALETVAKGISSVSSQYGL